jgi:hypothetical protein
MQYRRSIYRKRRIRVIIITSAVVLALLVSVFLILGNVLFDKANENDGETANTSATTDKHDSLPSYNVRQIKASAISLDGTLKDISSALNTAKTGGFNSVSVMMNSPDGKLTHHSDIAERLKYSIFNDSKISVNTFMESAKERSLYVSGVYYISAFSESDELARSVAMAELTTVISESLRAGVDEVILIAPDISEAQCSEVTHLISEIRSFVPDAVIGFALPESLVGSKNAEIIDELAKQVSFLALDLTKYGDADPLEFAKERTGAMLYSLLRYNMRVMIPSFEESEKQSSIVSAVESAGISNWQTVK